MALPKMTNTQLAEELADRADISRREAKLILGVLEGIVADNLSNCIRTPIGGVVIEPKLRAKTKARVGRNPQTGEEVQIAAKPASVRVAARATAKLKQYAPSVKKLSNAL